VRASSARPTRDAGHEPRPVSQNSTANVFSRRGRR